MVLLTAVVVIEVVVPVVVVAASETRVDLATVACTMVVSLESGMAVTMTVVAVSIVALVG